MGGKFRTKALDTQLYQAIEYNRRLSNVGSIAGGLEHYGLITDYHKLFNSHHPSILTTCGWDGKIITWDTVTGETLSSKLNVIEGEGRASVHEGVYSPDGEFNTF